MQIVGKISVKMKSSEQVMRRLGVDKRGAVQRFHTHNVARRIQKYMPYRSGLLIKAMLQNVTDTAIRVPGPHPRYLYYGKVMEGAAPKTVTDRDLKYTKTKNALAGPFWDRRLVASEMPVMRRELQAYVRRRVK